MKWKILNTVFAISITIGSLMLATTTRSDTSNQESDGIFDRVRFTYEGKPRHTEAIAGDEVVEVNIPSASTEGFEHSNDSKGFAGAKIKVGLFGDAQTKAVTVDLMPLKVLRHEGAAASKIVEGYSADFVANWRWASSDVKAGVVGSIEGTVYQNGKAKRFQVPLLIEAEATSDERKSDRRDFYPFVARIRWGEVKWGDGESGAKETKKSENE